MATNMRTRRSAASRAWDYLLAGRPLLPLAVVWLTTAGHTMNFREMGIGKGWVAADVYSLHSVYLVSIALVLLACPALGQHFSCRGLTRTGLAIMAAGSFLNGIYTYAPLSVFLAGRMMAGVGAGLVIYFAPRLLDIRWENPTTWASILLPVAGPAVIAGASMLYGWSAWEWGFLVEGASALLSLVVLLSMAEAPELPPPPPRGSLAFLPFLVLGSAALLYCLHWGQLHGWLESLDIVVAVASGTLFLALALLSGLSPARLPRFERGLDSPASVLLWRRGSVFPRHDHDHLQRPACQLQSVAAVLAGLVDAPGRRDQPGGRATGDCGGGGSRLGLPGAIVGLLILAGGMFSLHETTLDWPYWQIQNVVDLNWFQAPQHWELAPGRFLVGLGIGLFMFAMDTMFSPDPEREETIRPFLLVTQFFGGGIGIGLLISFLLISHPIQYSYVADRDYIQAEEFAERRAVLRDALNQAGEPAPDRQAEVLLYRTVNYESDNLVFAEIYATFMVASLGLAALCSGCWSGIGSVRLPGRRPRDRDGSVSAESTRGSAATDEKQSGPLDILVFQIR